MCGIVGFINADYVSKFGDKAAHVFEQLLWHDTQRGADGTGVVSINGSPQGLESTMFKNAMWAPDYMSTHTYRNLIAKRLGYARATIGHNRATTKGSVKNENAHPFVHKHITLVHNGWIPQYTNYLPQGVAHEVDSYAAAFNIAERGEKEGLEYVPFLGVLVWWNDQDKTLNMARNEHRELWCVGIKDQNAMFYASEWQMLHWILQRNGLEPSTKYRLLTPWNHFKFDVTKPAEFQKFPFEKPRSQSSSTTVTGGGQQQATGAGTGNSQQQAASGSKADAELGSRSKRADQFSESEVGIVERQFSKLSTKQKRKYGIPENRHKLRKVMAKIHNAGLDSYFGQKFVIYPDAWAPYKNQKANGCIMGCKRAEETIRVELPNTSPDDFERLKKDKWAFCTVVNAKKGKTGKWHLIGALIPLSEFNNPHKEEEIAANKDDGPNYAAEDGGAEEETGDDVLLKGPGGSLIPLAEFQARTQQGCGNCGSWINPSMDKDMRWFGNEPICHICACDAQVMAMLGFESKVAVH